MLASIDSACSSRPQVESDADLAEGRFQPCRVLARDHKGDGSPACRSQLGQLIGEPKIIPPHLVEVARM